MRLFSILCLSMLFIGCGDDLSSTSGNSSHPADSSGDYPSSNPDNPPPSSLDALIRRGRIASETQASKDIYHSLATCNLDLLGLRLEDVPRSGLVDKSDQTPLMRAIRYGCTDALKLLLEHGVDVNEQDGIGYTALHLAAMHNNKYAVRELIMHPESNPNIQDIDGRTPLIWAIFTQNDPSKHLDLGTIELFLNSPKVDNNIADSISDSSAIIYAAKLHDNGVMTLNRMNLFKLLLTTDVDVFHKDDYGFLAIDWARYQKNLRVAEMLEDHMYKIKGYSN